MFDSVVSFFIGNKPEDTNQLLQLWYFGRIMIGILLFDGIFDLFRFAKKFVPHKG